ncbi:MAG: PrsW family intramembrane metalloprotease [Chloroflexi bacterium]|nr:PrsW family intramembrane metalloprotease [Chloroflexota bacterium]
MRKQTLTLIQWGGMLLFLAGLPVALGCFCLTVLSLSSRSAEGTIFVSGVWAFALLTLGAGWTAFQHASNSLRGKVSKPLRLPNALVFVGVFGLSVALGLFAAQARVLPTLILPLVIIIAAVLPPLFAILWFARGRFGEVTWRRGLSAFAGGATVSVVIALALEIVLPVFVLGILNFFTPIVQNVRTLLNLLADADIAAALTNPVFLVVLAQMAIVAPLVEEFAKPLITLPVLRYLKRREAFLIAALAGAGFAAVENVIYAGFGLQLWAGVLLVRALGGAIHPLGAGLTGLGWQDVLQHAPNARGNWLKRYGLASGIHALWNGGSLILMTLAGAQFFGDLPPRLEIAGLAIQGVLLAFLLVLGLAALWAGRALVSNTEKSSQVGHELDALLPKTVALELQLSDRALAIWALACLVVIAPVGVIALRVLFK